MQVLTKKEALYKIKNGIPFSEQEQEVLVSVLEGESEFSDWDSSEWESSGCYGDSWDSSSAHC